MAKIKFYTDEHIAQAVGAGLRLRGIDVLSAKEARTLGFSDDDHLRLAYAQNRVLITKDHDFPKLHASGQPHAGIAFFSNNPPIGEMISFLLLLHEVMSAEEMSNTIEYL